MVVMLLLIPIAMIFFGKYFIKSAPKEISMAFGYRTSMSMKTRKLGSLHMIIVESYDIMQEEFYYYLYC